MKNHVQLIGYTGSRPEIHTSTKGKTSARVSLATNVNYKDKEGERQEKTTWHRVVAWNRTAELMDQLVKKGSRLLVEGSIQYRAFEDKEGIKRTYAEIVAQKFTLL